MVSISKYSAIAVASTKLDNRYLLLILPLLTPENIGRSSRVEGIDQTSAVTHGTPQSRSKIGLLGVMDAVGHRDSSDGTVRAPVNCRGNAGGGEALNLLSTLEGNPSNTLLFIQVLLQLWHPTSSHLLAYSDKSCPSEAH